jgi:predicted metal-dependent peptidase
MPTNLLDRVDAARRWLSTRIPFVGHLTLRLRLRIARPDDGVTTAAVTPNGTLILDEAWCTRLTDAELRFVVAHEVLHPALNFWGRLGNRDPMRFNYAHDLAINALLAQYADSLPGLLVAPEGTAWDPTFGGWSAEEIYDFLESEPSACPQAKGEAAPQPLRGDCCRGDEKAEDESPADVCRRQWNAALKHATKLENAGPRQGLIAAELEIALAEEIGAARIDWREALRQWCSDRLPRDDYGYHRPSRRAESAGAILAVPATSVRPELVLLWDTSGSMSDVHEAILDEVSMLVDELELTARLLVCDAKVHADVPRLANARAVCAVLCGGGGSDFRPAFSLLEDEESTALVIAFTDGYITVPDAPPPSLGGTLWAIVGGRRPAAWGEEIEIPLNL